MADFTKAELVNLVQSQATIIERLMAMFEDGDVKAKAQPVSYATPEPVAEPEAEVVEVQGHIYKYECTGCNKWYSVNGRAENGRETPRWLEHEIKFDHVMRPIYTTS